MHWIKKKQKTANIVDDNGKPKTKIEKTRKPWKTPKLKNHGFQVRKPKNRTKLWLSPQNRKSQRPPHREMFLIREHKPCLNIQ